MQLKEVTQKLKSLKNPKHAQGMARFGIRPKTKLYGIATPKLREIAKRIGKNQTLSLQLWDTKIHEARLLAGFIGEKDKVTRKQFKKWAGDFDSWDICDQVCFSLFDKVNFANNMVFELAENKKEFIKRTAFALMAGLAVHDKKLKDETFLKFFPLIKKASTDERNFVKKSVNWALRQIGKRNKKLNRRAIFLAKEILKIESKSARWIAKDAIGEIEGLLVQNRLKKVMHRDTLIDRSFGGIINESLIHWVNPIRNSSPPRPFGREGAGPV